MSSVRTDTERTITTSMRLPLIYTLRYALLGCANKNASCVLLAQRNSAPRTCERSLIPRDKLQWQ